MKWHHLGIQVKDLEESIAFYQQNFGFKIKTRMELDDESIVFLQKGPILIELIDSNLKVVSVNAIHFAWHVDNMNEWIHDLHMKSVFPVEGPIFLENGWRTVFYQGPNQEIIELFQG